MKKKTIKKSIAVILGIIIIIISVIVVTNFSMLKAIYYLRQGQVVNTKFNTSIPFEYDNRAIVVKVKIQGRFYRFFFDTGAVCVLSKELWNRLNIKEKAKMTQGQDSQGNTLKEDISVLPLLEIADLQFKDVGIMTLDIKNVPGLNCLGVDGVIGANILKKLIWNIDFENKQINVTDNPDVENIKTKSDGILHIPFEKTIMGQPVFDASITKDNILEVMFDTGSNGGWKFSKDTKGGVMSLPDDIAMVYGRSGAGGGGYGAIDTTYIAKIPQFEVGNDLIKNQLVRFDYSSTVGNKFLENYNLTINYFENLITLNPYKVLKKEQLRSFGIGFIYEDNEIKIGSFIKNEKTELPSIELGMRVLEINNMILSDSVSTDQFCNLFYSETNIMDKSDTLNLVLLDRNGEKQKYILSKKNLIN